MKLMSSGTGKKVGIKWIWVALLIAFTAFGVLGCTNNAETSSGQKSNSGNAQKEKAPIVRVASQPVAETLPTWIAVQEGLDKDNDYEIEVIYFDSGMPMIEALPANQWDVGQIGSPPMIMAGLRYNAYLIAVANEYAPAVKVMARPDSPAFQVKGDNSDYPEIYGSSDLLKEKTCVTTTVSTAHYALSKYLNALGLEDKDVKVMNMEQSQAVVGFTTGVGDAVALWPPFTLSAADQGLEVLATGADLGIKIPAVIIANKEFADAHPELVVKFLDNYFDGIEKIKRDDPANVEHVLTMYNDWAGMNIDREAAIKNISEHPVYDLKEQLEMFDDSNGASEIYLAMEDIADFLAQHGRIKPEEKDKVMGSNFINGKFLEMLAEEKGIK